MCLLLTFITYHSDPFEGKDGRPKEERVVLGSAHLGQVDGVSDVLQGKERKQHKHSHFYYESKASVNSPL